MNNKELAQWCINNNDMNQKRAEDIILLDMQKYDELKNLQWDFNELCIAYFLETIPLFWDIV